MKRMRTNNGEGLVFGSRPNQKMMHNGKDVPSASDQKDLPLDQQYAVRVYFGTENREPGSTIEEPRFLLKSPLRSVYAFSIRNALIFNSFIDVTLDLTAYLWLPPVAFSLIAHPASNGIRTDNQDIYTFQQADEPITLRTVIYQVLSGENPCLGLVPGARYTVQADPIAPEEKFTLWAEGTDDVPVDVLYDPTLIGQVRFGVVGRLSLPDGRYALSLPTVGVPTAGLGTSIVYSQAPPPAPVFAPATPLVPFWKVIATGEVAPSVYAEDLLNYAQNDVRWWLVWASAYDNGLGGDIKVAQFWLPRITTDPLTNNLGLDFNWRMFLPDVDALPSAYTMEIDAGLSVDIMQALSLPAFNGPLTLSDDDNLRVTIVCNGSPDLSTSGRVALECDAINNSQLISTTGENQWLATVPLASAYTTAQWYEPVQRQLIQTGGSSDIGAVKFALRDTRTNRLLDTNDTDWSVEIDFYTQDRVC